MTVLEEIQKPNLTSEEIEYAVRKLGRQPNSVEWAMLEAQWSEHCSYKSSRQVLKQLPTKGPRILVGPGYDAGVVDVGEGWVVSFHIESHNHPSAIDPYGGAATGVGGVIRDILSMGTRPIALLDPLRFGKLDSPHSRWLFENVVRGIGDYGNCIGVPTVGGEVEFDESFERNCLVDVVCVGLGKKKDLVMADADTPGDLVYIVGGSTGRDGIRGANFASRVLSEKSDSERSAVQVPDPFAKKLIIEAVLEAVNSGLVRGMKDLGGGGITCALSEMAAKGGTGVSIELDKVRKREPDMHPVEIMISESQERMALVINPKMEDKLIRILEKYEVPYSRIGTVTNDGQLTITLGGETVASAPSRFIAEAPLAHHSSRKPTYIDRLEATNPPEAPKDLGQTLPRLLASPNIANREWIYRQYDHEVGIRTLLKPGEADSAQLQLPNGKRLAVAIGGNSKHCYLDPYWGSIGAVSEALCNLAATGAQPLAVVDHLQFGNPNNPEVYWTFKESVRGITDYLTAVKVACVGGKVSFYNEDAETGTAIKPSPVISAIGLVEKQTRPVREAFTGKGNDVIIVGETGPEMGGSEYYEHIHRVTGGTVPRVRLKTEKKLLAAIVRTVRSNLVLSAHDCSKGGLAVTLSEMAIKSGRVGFKVNLDRLPGKVTRSIQCL
jgi:phosphoribosylformylglycinamidine synthase